jgi:hypothetical protein
MSTLLSADEVRPAEFGATAKSAIHSDMVAIPEAIIGRRSGAFHRRASQTAIRTRCAS